MNTKPEMLRGVGSAGLEVMGIGEFLTIAHDIVARPVAARKAALNEKAQGLVWQIRVLKQIEVVLGIEVSAHKGSDKRDFLRTSPTRNSSLVAVTPALMVHSLNSRCYEAKKVLCGDS